MGAYPKPGHPRGRPLPLQAAGAAAAPRRILALVFSVKLEGDILFADLSSRPLVRETSSLVAHKMLHPLLLVVEVAPPPDSENNSHWSFPAANRIF